MASQIKLVLHGMQAFVFNLQQYVKRRPAELGSALDLSQFASDDQRTTDSGSYTVFYSSDCLVREQTSSLVTNSDQWILRMR